MKPKINDQHQRQADEIRKILRGKKSIEKKWLLYKEWESNRGIFGPVARPHCRILCGCLTQVHNGSIEAETFPLTEAIRADDRIPCYGDEVLPKHLTLFVEWRRRIDRELKKLEPSRKVKT